MRKIIQIISNVDRSPFFETIADCLESEEFESSFIFIHSKPPFLLDYHKGKGRRVEFIEYRGKKDFFRALFKAYRLIKEIKPDIVHGHLAEGSLIGMTAAKLAGVAGRVYTRHHSIECHTYYPHAVYYDRICNRLAKLILANSSVTAEVLSDLEGVPAEKIEVMHYGYDLGSFKSSEDRVRELKSKYGLDGSFPVIGVISRFVDWKGVHFIIPAFASFRKNFPEAKLVLANATGPDKERVSALLKEHLPPDSYVLIEFESQIFDLYKTFDAFVHVPINRSAEAFGQVYVESLLFGVPSVFTLSGIANDIVRDGDNALVVPYSDSESIAKALERMFSEEGLRQALSSEGSRSVSEIFASEVLKIGLENVYLRLTNDKGVDFHSRSGKGGEWSGR